MGNSQPGRNAATASLVLGIIGIVCWIFGPGAIVSVILGIIGLVLAAGARKAGFVGGIQTAGFILSLVSLVVGVIVFVACVACISIPFAAGETADIAGAASTL